MGYWWMVLPNNCVSFVEKVLDAGDSDWSSITNCPVLAADVILDTISRFFQQMTANRAWHRPVSLDEQFEQSDEIGSRLNGLMRK